MNRQLIKDIESSFVNEFNEQPIMIFSPGRINIIGEHTDYNDGFALPAAVNKGIVAAIQKSNSNFSTARAFNKDEQVQFSLDDLKPSSEGSWENYILGVVAELLNRSQPVENFNITFGGDIPGGAGMSSSAAIENSVVFGLNELFNLNLTKDEMTLISQKAEHNYVGVQCGIMDQYASMFGIEDNVLLLDCKTGESEPFEIKFDNYEILLINSNVKHSLSDSAYNDRRSACENVAKMLGVRTLRESSVDALNKIKDNLSENNYQIALYILKENERVIKATQAIQNNSPEELGQLLYESHHGLQHNYKVSVEELDFMVDFAKKNGVTGSRMMGGGFGGCTINLIQKDKVEDFKEKIRKAYFDKFIKECSIYSVSLVDGTRRIN